MKHDLDLINAALRLGDNFSFPVGVIVIDEFGNRLRVLRAGFTSHLDQLRCITQVPEDAPAFRSWPRCEKSKVKPSSLAYFVTGPHGENDGSSR